MRSLRRVENEGPHGADRELELAGADVVEVLVRLLDPRGLKRDLVVLMLSRAWIVFFAAAIVVLAAIGGVDVVERLTTPATSSSTSSPAPTCSPVSLEGSSGDLAECRGAR